MSATVKHHRSVKLGKTGCGFWLGWVCLTLIGFLISLYWIEIGESSDANVVEGVVGGVVIGVAQWVALRQRFSSTGWWVLASCLCWGFLGSSELGSVGWVVPQTLNIPLRGIYGTVQGAIVGALLGVVQWLVLQNQVLAAWRWISASVAGWALGLAFGWILGAVLHVITGVFLGEVVGLFLAWVIVASVTGVALCHLRQEAGKN